MLHRTFGLLGALLLVIGGIRGPLAVAQVPDDDEPTILEVTVLDSSTGRPLAGVRLRLSGYQGQEQIRGDHTTDTYGIAAIPIPQGELRHFGFTTRKDGYVPMRVSWPAPDDRGAKSKVPGTYTLRLEPATRVSGRVIDDAGEPVNSAKVVLHFMRKPNGNETLNVSYESVSTDASGNWEFDRAPAAFDEVDIGVHHPEYASGYRGGSGFFAMNAFYDVQKLRDGTATLTLPRGVKIEGVVLGPNDKPVAGARVGIGSDRVASNMIPEVKTDGSGKFRMASFAGDSVVLTVMAKGFAPELQQFTLGSDPHKVEFRLQPAKTLRGRVVDDEGKPIRNVMVVTEGWRGARTVSARLNTDDEGRFTWKDAPVDPVNFDLLIPGYADQRGVSLVAGDQEHVITMHRPLIVSGTVVDAETGKPVESFKMIGGIVFDERPPHWERDERFKPSSGGTFQYELSFPYPGYALRIEAPGYMPAESRVFKQEERQVKLEFKLVKGKDVSGVIHLPDGSPAVGVQVVLGFPGQMIYLVNGKDLNDRGCITTTTDEQGKYAFPPQTGSYVVVAFSEKGYAQVESEELAKSPDITLQAWAVVEGEVRNGSKPDAGAELAIYQRSVFMEPSQPRIYHQLSAKADADGKFRFPRVVPGEIAVGKQVSVTRGPGMMTAFSQTTNAIAKAGETTKVQIGGVGRAVVGRVEIPPSLAGRKSYHFGFSAIETNAKPPNFDVPPEVHELEPAARKQWFDEWKKSEAGQAYMKATKEHQESVRRFALVVDQNGQFRADDIPEGDYVIRIQVYEATPAGSSNFEQELAVGSKEFTITPMPGGRSDDPLDVGAVSLQAITTLKVGDVAPAFAVPTLDGKQISLADFKGRYVLVDFWATWCAPCVAEIPGLKKLQDEVGADERFVMISLSLDETIDAAQAFVKKREMNWQNAYLGPWAKATVPNDYGVRGIPAMFLVGPDGKIVARDLRADAALAQIKAALGAKPQ